MSGLKVLPTGAFAERLCSSALLNWGVFTPGEFIAAFEDKADSPYRFGCPVNMPAIWVRDANFCAWIIAEMRLRGHRGFDCRTLPDSTITFEFNKAAKSAPVAHGDSVLVAPGDIPSRTKDSRIKNSCGKPKREYLLYSSDSSSDSSSNNSGYCSSASRDSSDDEVGWGSNCREDKCRRVTIKECCSCSDDDDDGNNGGDDNGNNGGDDNGNNGGDDNGNNGSDDNGNNCGDDNARVLQDGENTALEIVKLSLEGAAPTIGYRCTVSGSMVTIVPCGEVRVMRFLETLYTLSDLPQPFALDTSIHGRYVCVEVAANDELNIGAITIV